MAQMVIYIEAEAKQRIEQAAKANHQSASRWVTETCLRQLQDEWPSTFINAFGSIKDDTFQIPDQASFEPDAPREAL